MNRFLDKELTEKFILENFDSRKDFVKAWGVSYSHFLKMLEKRGKCGDRSLVKLKNLLEKFNYDVEEILEPIPMIIGDMEVLEIIVKDKNDNLIAYINSNTEITDDNYAVEYIQV